MVKAEFIILRNTTCIHRSPQSLVGEFHTGSMFMQFIVKEVQVWASVF